MPSSPYIAWERSELIESGRTLRAPVAGATREWCEAFKAEADLMRHLSFQRPWGDIGLIGVTIFVPSISPGAEDRLRQTLDGLVATAQRRAAAAPPQQSPEEMLELMRSLSG